MAAALNSHIDDVLFSDDPAGAAFRSNVLDGHPQEQDAIRAELHGALASFLRLTGKTGRILLEVD